MVKILLDGVKNNLLPIYDTLLHIRISAAKLRSILRYLIQRCVIVFRVNRSRDIYCQYFKVPWLYLINKLRYNSYRSHLIHSI